jgi:hypothetical protein
MQKEEEAESLNFQLQQIQVLHYMKTLIAQHY